MDLIFRHRQQHLTRASKLGEACEYRSDCVLQTQIGVQSKPRPPMPERNGKSQFATARFRSGGIEHAGSQHAKFELADTALHPQQQTIIGPTWIVDTIVIYDAGFNEAT